jgi:hypothetical protein
MLRSTLVTLLALFAADMDRASAQDVMCPAYFSVGTGREAKGVLPARAGVACQVPISVYGNLTLSSIVIVRGPTYGSASPLSTGVLYRPRPGYTGADTMTLRLLGVSGRTGKPVQSIVHLDISVH